MTAFYLVYSRRGTSSAPTASRPTASRTTRSTTPSESSRGSAPIGTYHEESIQDWFLPHRTFLQFWNTYYGVAHFVRHARRVHRAVRPAPAGLPAAPQHARGDDRGRHRRVRAVPADAATTPRRAVPGAGAERRGRVRRAVHPVRPARRGRIRLRRHPRRVRGPVVVRLRGDGVDLEPVRRDAEPAHRLVGVVRDRGVAVAAAAVEPHRCG